MMSGVVPAWGFHLAVGGEKAQVGSGRAGWRAQKQASQPGGSRCTAARAVVLRRWMQGHRRAGVARGGARGAERKAAWPEGGEAGGIRGVASARVRRRLRDAVGRG